MDQDGNIIFQATGEVNITQATWTDERGDMHELSYNAIRGTILADDGSEITAYIATSEVIERIIKPSGEILSIPNARQNNGTTFCPKYNCSGNALLNGRLVISSHLLTESIFEAEGFRVIPNDQAQVGDVGLYHEKGVLQHLEIQVMPGLASSKGGIENDKGLIKPGSNSDFASKCTYSTVRDFTENSQVLHSGGRVLDGVRIVDGADFSRIKANLNKGAFMVNQPQLIHLSMKTSSQDQTTTPQPQSQKSESGGQQR